MKGKILDIYFSSSLNKNLNTVVEFVNEMGANLEISRFGKLATIDSEYDDFLNHYKSVLKNLKRKLTLHSFFYDLNPASLDPGMRNFVLHRYNQAFTAARELNANTIVFHTGYNGLIKHADYHNDFFNGQETFWANFIKQFENAGITAVVENTCENNPEVLMKIVDSVNSKNLKACIDAGHANINSEFGIEEWIKKIGKRLHHMHIHNNYGKLDEHNSVLSGTIDFSTLVATLEKESLTPNLVLEIFNKDSAVESFNFVQKQFELIKAN